MALHIYQPRTLNIPRLSLVRQSQGPIQIRDLVVIDINLVLGPFRVTGTYLDFYIL